jgi:hypothetical protein
VGGNVRVCVPWLVQMDVPSVDKEERIPSCKLY